MDRSVTAKYVISLAAAFLAAGAVWAADAPAAPFSPQAAPSADGGSAGKPVRPDPEADANEKEEFDFANGLFARGMHDMSIEGYRDFIRHYPASRYLEAANYRIGENLFLLKRYKEAFDWFENFKKGFPGGEYFLKACLKEGQIYFFLNDLAAADVVMSSLIVAGNPKEVLASANYYKALLRIKAGNYAEARGILEKFMNNFPDNEYLDLARMDLGDIYMMEKSPKKAAVLFEAVADGGKIGNGKPELRTADAYYTAGDYSRAAAFYRKAIESGKGDPEVPEMAASGYITALYDDRKYKEIVEKYPGMQAMVRNEAAGAQMMFAYASSLLHENKFAEAESAYKGTADRYPDTDLGVKARLNQCWAIYKSGDMARSFALVDSYVATEKNLRDEALYLKGKILADSNRPEEAIAVFDKVMRDFKTSPFAKEALYDTALVCDRGGNIEKAAGFYRLFVNTYPGDDRCPEALLKSGQNYLKKGKYKEAEESYKSFLSKFPGNALKENVLFQLGSVYAETKNYKSVIGTYEKFLKEFPSSEAAGAVKYWTGRAHQELGDTDRALGIYDGIIREKGNKFRDTAMESSAFCFFTKGDKRKAADTYYALMKEGTAYVLPDDIYRWVADHYLNNARYDEVLGVLEQYLLKHPDGDGDGAVSYMRGEALRNLGSQDEARVYLRKLTESGISSPFVEKAFLSLGRSYLSSGDSVKALEAFEESLRFHQDDMVGAYARFEIGEIKYKDGKYDEAAKMYAMVGILYEDKDLCPKAFFKAADSFVKAGMADKADEMIKELARRYPGATFDKKAQDGTVSAK
jgi:TolA-binding protein